MSVIGVDPGTGGALALYDHVAGVLDVQDMPCWYMQVGSKKRRRVDPVALLEYFEMQKMMGATLVLIEAVGGRPRQSASGAFVFGYTAGLIYMACIACRLPIETVPPQVWKRTMRLPGKKKGEKEGKTPKQIETEIINRADELFPDHRNKWRGPQGGYKLDRAEAALLARYAADYALRSTEPIALKDVEWQLAYRNADLGA